MTNVLETKQRRQIIELYEAITRLVKHDLLEVIPTKEGHLYGGQLGGFTYSYGMRSGIETVGVGALESEAPYARIISTLLAAGFYQERLLTVRAFHPGPWIEQVLEHLQTRH